jgi:hypothetical protein
MQRVLLAPFAVLLDLKTLLNLLLILKSMVVNTLANRALQFYQVILGHIVLLF